MTVKGDIVAKKKKKKKPSSTKGEKVGFLV